MTVISKLLRFVRNEDGPTAVEYAVMLTLVLAVIISTVTTVGETVRTSFAKSTAKFAETNGVGH